MHSQLLAQSPLLALPLFALVVFAGVFISVVIRAFATGDTTLRSMAALPLGDESEPRHDH